MRSSTASLRFYWGLVPWYQQHDPDIRRDIKRLVELDALVLEIDRYIRTKPNERSTARVVEVAKRLDDVLPGYHGGYRVAPTISALLEGLWDLGGMHSPRSTFRQRGKNWEEILDLVKPSRRARMLDKYTNWLMMIAGCR